MRKSILTFGKRVFVSAVSLAMFVSSFSIGDVYAKEEVIANQEVVTVADTTEVEEAEVPEGKVLRKEVFSQSGKIEHVDIQPEEQGDFEDVPLSESSAFHRYNAAEDAWNDMLPDTKPQMVYQAEDFAYRDLVNNGSDSDNYCILICGDGYTAGEQEKFLNVAQSIANYFMTRVPFSDSNIKNKINIRAVCTVSNQSGTSMDPNNPYDTYFKATFNNYNIERLVCIHDGYALERIKSQYMPSCNVPIVVCNSSVYGGSGGSVCVISEHSDATDIAFHEFGHTGGGLADEYWESTTDASNRSEAPNRTHESDPSRCKWSHLIGNNGVGLYPFDEANDWYRPHQSCEMRYLKQEFCEVCKEQIRKQILGVVGNSVGDNVVINTADELKDYINKVASGAKTTGKTVSLANDITLSGTVPVMAQFDGTFEGNGHTIRNLSINVDSGSTGLIGYLGENGIVRNLALENASVTGTGYYIGGIVGWARGQVYNCSVSGTVTGDNGVGGVVGYVDGSGYVHDNYNTATVRANNQVAGGIVGWQADGTVKNCHDTGSIISGDNYWFGGIVGYKPGGNLSNCYYLSSSASGGQDQGAESKSSTDFSNGTVTNLLNEGGSTWKQGNGYPVLYYAKIFNAFSKIEAEQFSSMEGGVIDTNSNASGGFNIGGVSNGVTAYYDIINFTERAGAFTIQYSSPSGTAQGNVEIYVDDWNNRVASITLPNNASGWDQYGTYTANLERQIEPGTHKIITKYVTTGEFYYVANVDYFQFERAPMDAFGRIEAEQYSSMDGGVIDTNGNASGGYNIGGVVNGVTAYYNLVTFSEKAGSFTIHYSSPESQAQGNVEIYVDDFNNRVATIALANNASGWEQYGTYTTNLEREIEPGTHKIITKYVTTGDRYYVANVDYFQFAKALNTINGGIEINGYQVSARAKGMRTVYSVDSQINGKNVVGSGIIYSLVGYAQESEMVIGSNNPYVKNFDSTQNGKMSGVYSNSDIATSYAMTMLFATKAPGEYQANYRIRAYARLDDGSYVYTGIQTYSPYNVADSLYQNRQMGSAEAHNYLYTDILSVVNGNYGQINYN